MPRTTGLPQGKEDPEMKRCMFVDDSSVIRKVAKRILGGSDMVVIEAASGLDALEMCAADMPDIRIIVKTNRGNIEATLYASKAPITVANYLNLAKEILQKNNLTRISQEERTLEEES